MWKFYQCFGEKTPVEEVFEQDILSAVEFDETGTYLATGACLQNIWEITHYIVGDYAGRVVVFEVDEDRPHALSTSSLKSSIGQSNSSEDLLEYKFQCEFQSHEPEFDYLKSLEIEEKINKIRWCKPSNNALFLLR